MPPLLVTRIAVALVWLYEGLWCKLLGGAPSQVGVVEAVPLFGPRWGAQVLRAVGVVECALGVWVLSGWRPYLAAAAQTALLVAMNTCGLFWARRAIQDPAGMVIKNVPFLVLAWVAAAQTAARIVG